MRKKEGMYDVMRNCADDVKFETLHHCCIHSHAKTSPDKAVEKGKAGQGSDKEVIKGLTTRTRTDRPSLDKAETVRERGQKTAGGQHPDTGFKGAARDRGQCILPTGEP